MEESERVNKFETMPVRKKLIDIFSFYLYDLSLTGTRGNRGQISKKFVGKKISINFFQNFSQVSIFYAASYSPLCFLPSLFLVGTKLVANSIL